VQITKRYVLLTLTLLPPIPIINLLGTNPIPIETYNTFTDSGAAAFYSCFRNKTLDITTNSALINYVGGQKVTDDVLIMPN
jgi:hypothetical protein